MTTVELIEEFSLRIDKVGTAGQVGFTEEEIESFLNDAQLQWVQTRYSGTNPRGESLEETQLRIDSLRVLISSLTYLLLPSDYDPTLEAFILSEAKVAPVQYFHSLSHRIKAKNIKCNNQFVKECPLVQSDELGYLFEDPFERPNLARPKIVFSDNFIELYIGNPNLNGNYDVFFLHRYLRFPNKIDLLAGITSELPSTIHTELVDLAVFKALTYIGSSLAQQYFQTISFRE